MIVPFAAAPRPTARGARSVAATATLAVCVALALGGHRAAAEAPPQAPLASASACAAWDVEYAIAGSLGLTDTPMGQGDGVFPIGPGSLVVRFDDRAGQPGGAARMIAYEIRQSFTVASKTLFWKTSVTNESVTRGILETCGPNEGTLRGPLLEWTAPVRSFRTDGTLVCEGLFCGSFGAPPPGRSAMHIGPNPVDFKPFQFSGDHKTFTMASTFVTRTESPKATAHMALSGRESRRTCQPTACN